MKKLGLIGGMGPESTLPYYQGIVYGVQKKMGQPFFPHFTVESVNVFQILSFLNAGDKAALVDYLLTAINNLANAGADFIALASNTPHIVFEQLQEKSPLRIISIIEATCKEAVTKGYKTIGLIGTIFTMNNDFFKTPFERNGIKVVIPNDVEMHLINDRIYNEIELGVIKQETINEFLQIINRLKTEENIEAIVLGCTELPLLLNDAITPVPCLDTMKIHIDAIVNEIM